MSLIGEIEQTIEQIITDQLEYDKEVYDEHTYTREYRHLKLTRLYSSYAELKVAYMDIYSNDIANNGSGKYQYGIGGYDSMPREFTALIDVMQEYQTIHLNLFYPNLLRDLCFEQNMFFLDVACHLQGNEKENFETLDKVYIIIPVCYIMCFARDNNNNKLQVLFYQTKYTRTDFSEKSFFVDYIPLKDIKNKKKRETAVFNYIMNLQYDLFEGTGDVLDTTDFKTSFMRIVSRGV